MAGIIMVVLGIYGLIQANLANERAQIALARQLAVQAQSITATENSRQMIAVLLAIQSMKMFASSEAAEILQNKNFAGRQISNMTHYRNVSSIAFSPDGKYVVSGSWDNTARVWEAATGNEVARMTHDGSVTSVAFSSDGKYVVSGGGDTARVWEWKAKDLITNACETIPRNLTRAEWKSFIGNVLPYQAVCLNLPIESEDTITPSQ